MKVVVTGVSGLIGSRVATTLQDRGLSVIATSRSPSCELRNELGMDVSSWDVLKSGEPSLSGVEGGALVHCATANDIVSRDACNGYNLTIAGTWNVLQAALKLGIKKVLFFSTFQVYGTELSGEIAESTLPRCETPYGQNHWFGEEVCRLVGSKNGLDIAILRPSNVYGAPVVSTVHRETLVPTCFVRSALTDGQIVLHSSGKQMRNFVSTREVADACVQVLDDQQVGIQIYNVCSAYTATMRELAEMTAGVYQTRFGKVLPVKSLSDQPVHSNQFTARSRLESNWNSYEESQLQMQSEIEMLFEHFVKTPQIAS